MRTQEYINIDLVNIDRWPLNPSTLSLIDAMRSGIEIPPIKVSRLKNGRFNIKDGRHRLLTHKLLGLKKIKAEFSTKFLKD